MKSLTLVLCFVLLFLSKTYSQIDQKLPLPDSKFDSVTSYCEKLIERQQFDSALFQIQTQLLPSIPDTSNFTLKRIKILELQANIDYYKGDFSSAEGNYSKAINLLRKDTAKHDTILVEYLCNKATVQTALGKKQDAENLYLESLKLLQPYIDSKARTIADINASIGIHFTNNSDYENGEKHLLEAIEIYEKTNDTQNAFYFYCHSSLGSIYSRIRQFQSALKSLELVKSHHIKTSDTLSRGYAYTLHELGLVHYYLQNYDDAEKTILESKRIYQSIETGKRKRSYAGSLCALGSIYLKKK